MWSRNGPSAIESRFWGLELRFAPALPSGTLYLTCPEDMFAEVIVLVERPEDEDAEEAGKAAGTGGRYMRVLSRVAGIGVRITSKGAIRFGEWMVRFFRSLVVWVRSWRRNELGDVDLGQVHTIAVAGD